MHAHRHLNVRRAQMCAQLHRVQDSAGCNWSAGVDAWQWVLVRSNSAAVGVPSRSLRDVSGRCRRARYSLSK
eukprot:3440791-Lingulodinium_polyedra.AAC.1